MRAPWEPEFGVGHELIDAQHQGLLTQCELLADLCQSTDGEGGAAAFDQAFDRLEVMARVHFEAEAAMLASLGSPDVEDYLAECDEFDYLAGEIATAENFDRLELQRFLTLWLTGHINGWAPRQRELLAGAGGAG
jgi:hemerythrin-like metal-binding protein